MTDPGAARAELEAAGWFTDGRYDQMLAAGRERIQRRHQDGVPVTRREYEQVIEWSRGAFTDEAAEWVAEQVGEAAQRRSVFVLADGTELPFSLWIQVVKGHAEAELYRERALEGPGPEAIPAGLRHKILASGLVSEQCRLEAQAEEDELTGLAGRWFGEMEQPGLQADGVPPHAIADLRRTYIDAALRSPAAATQLREHYGAAR